MADKDELIATSSTPAAADPKPEDSKPEEKAEQKVDAKPLESKPKEKAKPKEKGGKSKEKPAESSGGMTNRLPNLYSRFVSSFENALSQLTDEPAVKPKLRSLDLEGVAAFIRSGDCRNVTFMVGAGISTSAGVPDFRSPGTGLYDNLQKYHLPHPMAVFELDFFESRPEPFFSLARELFHENLKPTPTHYFMRLMDEKKYVRRIYTQNIDSLEYLAGIPASKVITAHGSHQTSTCLKCRKKYSFQWMNDFLKQKEPLVPRCSCGGLIKPDIVFFGEALPTNFFTSAVNDFPKTDLLIIIGTSLVVQPFASMVHEVSGETPRLLINLTPAGKIGKREQSSGFAGLYYNEAENQRDVFWQGTADDGCMKLAELLGIDDELKAIIKREWAKIDEKIAATGKKTVEEAKPEVQKL